MRSLPRRPVAAAVVFALAASLPFALPARRALADDPAPAAPPDAARLALATERVVVFKDGYALFVKAGTATADAEGRVSSDGVPAGAVLGCVWALAEDRRVLGMRTAWEERRETRTREEPCLSTLDLLRANVGQTVTLGLVKDNAADVTGRVVEVLEAEPPHEDSGLPPSARPAPTGPAGRSVRPVATVGGTLVVVEPAGKARLVMPVADVRTVSGASLSTRIVRREEVVTKSKRLSIDLGRDAAGKPASVHLLYFAEGVRWIPTYRIEGDLLKDARVALQGEVLNEAEPIEGAALDLVVGVPTFRFRDVASPLSLEQALRSTLRNAAPQLAQQMASNRNVFFSNDEGGEERGGGASTPIDAAPDLARESRQDLFVYGVGKTTIGKGARATYPLWQSVVPLRHVYTMDLHVMRNERSGDAWWRSAKDDVPASAPRPTRAGTNLVWHEVELRNGSEVPWTTGAALLMQGDVPIGQDLLPYTSPGAASLVPMTSAVDVQGRWEERETERQPNALHWSGNTYSLVRKRGTATVVNRRKESSHVRVTASLGGHAEEATAGGTVTLNDMRGDDWGGGGYAVNNHSDVVWEADLAPGETKTFEVVFSFYVL